LGFDGDFRGGEGVLRCWGIGGFCFWKDGDGGRGTREGLRSKGYLVVLESISNNIERGLLGRGDMDRRCEQGDAARSSHQALRSPNS